MLSTGVPGVESRDQTDVFPYDSMREDETNPGAGSLEADMEFAEVVMKRRAVRRFEEAGVDREVIERIAGLAQRVPSAGFSQGQRLVVVTDPDRRREVARLCGEEAYDAMGFGPWISECAAQFVPCVSEAIYHRRYQEPDKVEEDGSEIAWPIPYWWVDVGATMQNVMLAAVDEGLASGFVGVNDAAPLCAYLGIPDEFTPIGVMPVGRPLPDMRSPSLKRGWVPFEQFAHWEAW
jgi:nitroreductase